LSAQVLPGDDGGSAGWEAVMQKLLQRKVGKVASAAGDEGL